MDMTFDMTLSEVMAEMRKESERWEQANTPVNWHDGYLSGVQKFHRALEPIRYKLVKVVEKLRDEKHDQCADDLLAIVGEWK